MTLVQVQDLEFGFGSTKTKSSGSTDRTVFENHRKGIIQQFNNASEASYVYILRGQKLIKNAKNGPF